MKPVEIEAWALRVIDHLKAQQPIEDARVELKAKFPADHEKAARGIAAHANSARGDDILWLVGVDEGAFDVVGTSPMELSAWWPQVVEQFEGRIAPGLTPVNLFVDGRTVVLLHFGTDRAPYVVRNPSFGRSPGPVAWEVPWREGNRTRSATRADLIRLLMPIQALPTVELLSGRLSLSHERLAPLPGNWYLYLYLFVAPRLGQVLVFPHHYTTASFAIPESAPEIPLKDIQLFEQTGITASWSTYEGRPPRGRVTETDMLMDRPGPMHITAKAISPVDLTTVANQPGMVTVHLRALETDRPVVFRIPLIPHPDAQDGVAAWKARDALHAGEDEAE